MITRRCACHWAKLFLCLYSVPIRVEIKKGSSKRILVLLSKENIDSFIEFWGPARNMGMWVKSFLVGILSCKKTSYEGFREHCYSSFLNPRRMKQVQQCLWVLFQVQPQLTQIQGEMQQTVIEMCKIQKTYNIDESQAFDARAKAKEAEEK